MLCFRVWCACFYLLLPWWHDHPLTHVGHQLIRLPLFLASSNNIFEFRLPSVSDSSFCILFTHKHNCDDNYRRRQIDSVGRDSCEYSPPRQRARACVCAMMREPRERDGRERDNLMNSIVHCTVCGWRWQNPPREHRMYTPHNTIHNTQYEKRREEKKREEKGSNGGLFGWLIGLQGNDGCISQLSTTA